jgi:hypothetical protein
VLSGIGVGGFVVGAFLLRRTVLAR